MTNIKNFKQFVNESATGIWGGMGSEPDFKKRCLAGKNPEAVRIAEEIHDACKGFGVDLKLLNMSADWDEEGFVKALRQIRSRADYQQIDEILKCVIRYLYGENDSRHPVEGAVGADEIHQTIKADPRRDVISLIAEDMFGPFDGDEALMNEATDIIRKYTTDRKSVHFDDGEYAC